MKRSPMMIPAALAAALLVAGSATQAFAESHEHDSNSTITGSPSLKTTVNARYNTSAWDSDASANLTMKEARLLAEQAIGGSAIRSGRIGSKNGTYKFDIQDGNQVKSVYVNRNTGRMTITASLDPGMDFSSIAGNGRDKEHQFRSAG